MRTPDSSITVTATFESAQHAVGARTPGRGEETAVGRRDARVALDHVNGRLRTRRAPQMFVRPTIAVAGVRRFALDGGGRRINIAEKSTEWLSDPGY